MRRLLLAVPLLAAGCATTAPYAPVRDISFQALGQNPAWHVVIGDDRIVFGPVAGAGDGSWPRVLPRTVDGVRTWQSGSAADSITVTARRAACRLDGPGRDAIHQYENVVTVQPGAGGPQLQGCGGRIMAMSSGEPR